HHLGVRDVGQLDLAVRVLLVPGRDQHVNHLLVPARALPHGELARAGAAGGGGRPLAGRRRRLRIVPTGREGQHRHRRHQDRPPDTSPHPTHLHVEFDRLQPDDAVAPRGLGGTRSNTGPEHTIAYIRFQEPPGASRKGGTAGSDQATIWRGCSRAALSCWRKPAPGAPSRARWWIDRVTRRRRWTWTPPSWVATGSGRAAPTARIAASGGVITARKCSTPHIARL